MSHRHPKRHRPISVPREIEPATRALLGSQLWADVERELEARRYAHTVILTGIVSVVLIVATLAVASTLGVI